MKTNKIFAVAALISVVGNLFAMEKYAETDKQLFGQMSLYNGQRITPESVVKLFPGSLSEKHSDVQEWLDKNSGTVKPLVAWPDGQDVICAQGYPDYVNPNLYDLQQHRIAGTIHLCSNNGLRDASYIFIIPGKVMTAANHKTAVAVKVAAHNHRMHNLFEQLGLYCRSFAQRLERSAELNALSKDTYQTISNAANYLRMDGIIAKHNFKQIVLPELFLVPVDQKYEGPATDRTHYIVQGIPDENIMVPLKKAIYDKDFLRLLVNEELIAQLYELAKSTALWNLADTVYTDKKHLYVFGFQQPDKTAPVDFYNNHVAKAFNNFYCGVLAIAELFAQDSDQRNQLLSAIKQDSDISEGLRDKLFTDAQARPCIFG